MDYTWWKPAPLYHLMRTPRGIPPALPPVIKCREQELEIQPFPANFSFFNLAYILCLAWERECSLLCLCSWPNEGITFYYGFWNKSFYVPHMGGHCTYTSTLLHFLANNYEQNNTTCLAFPTLHIQLSLKIISKACWCWDTVDVLFIFFKNLAVFEMKRKLIEQLKISLLFLAEISLKL